MKNVLIFLSKKIKMFFEIIKKVDNFLNKREYITIVIWIALLIKNLLLKSGSAMNFFFFSAMSIILLIIILKINKIKSIIFILGIILFSMVNFNIFGNESYSWIKNKNGSYEEASIVYFNPKFWKVPDNLIIRNDDFGRNNSFFTSDPIHIKIKSGDFEIHRYVCVEVSRKTWEEFSFSEKDLRSFLEKEIKQKILNSFDQCSIEKTTDISMSFKYDGKKCISANIR